LLLALPAADAERLAPLLTPLDLDKGSLLYEAGDAVDFVYFPHDCVISLMTLMQSGAAIESATIGREGALGLAAATGPRHAHARAIVQGPGRASRIGATALGEAMADSAAMRALFERHGEALLSHAMQGVACNALHTVEARFCRWLLTRRDRMDSDTLTLTQEFLADMLGVQRTTVTAIAGQLQARGVIRYRRGQLDILDRPALEAIACECYRAVRSSYERLIPGAFA
jgi:CRP-like cAMP-binding protein